METDWALLFALNRWAAGPLGASFASFLSSYWVPVLALVPLSAVALQRRRPLMVASLLFVFGLGDLVVSRVAKPIFDRDRPCHIRKDLHTPDGCGTGRSFPSGHATNAFALAVTGGLFWPRALFVLAPVAVLVSGSRIVLGVHFPSDVTAGALAGALLGAFVGLIGLRLERRFLPAAKPTSE